MRVVLAEKPDMGKKIAEAFSVKKNNKGYIELTNGDVVTWAIGHLIRLKTPDQYDQYKEWRLDQLPIIPDPMLSEVDPEKKQQFDVIRKLLDKAETCIIATDPGREGEHIARTILEACNYKGKLLRLWIHDLTPETIKHGFQQLKDASLYNNLAAAADARAKADYWIGFTATRFFTLVAREVTGENTLLSAGRVQTPTLRIVYDRELAIEQFKSEPFYVVHAKFQHTNGSYSGQWFKETNEDRLTRFSSKAEAEKIIKKISGQTAVVVHYEEKMVQRQAPQLLHSTSIKTAARKELGFSIEKTTKVLQSIYDKGYVTYPRTSSRHLSVNAANQLVSRLESLRNEKKYAHLFPDDIRSLTGNARYVDDAKATEHHAIVPTGKNPANLTEDEIKLYELILRYTLAAHHQPGIDKVVQIITELAGETFSTKAVVIKETGWRKIMKGSNDEKDSDQDPDTVVSDVPQLNQGDSVAFIEAGIREGKTSAPKRLTDDELEKAMEHAGRIVDDSIDEEVMDFLKEKGIGTPATRTLIIQELINREYISIKKNLVYLTEKGRNFMDLIHNHPLASIELTGEFEKKLNDVSEGKISASALLGEYRTFIDSILATKDMLVKSIQDQSQDKPIFQNITAVGSCPNCGKAVVERDNFFGCTGYKEGCKVTLPKEFLKTKITKKVAQDLLSGKEVLLKDIPGKFGAFNLFVRYHDFRLHTRKPTAEDLSCGNCPHCGQLVLDRGNFYGCSGYKDGCTFTLPKQILGKALSKRQIQLMLTKGKTDLIKGMKGKTGTFDAAISYDSQQKKLIFITRNS